MIVNRQIRRVNDDFAGFQTLLTFFESTRNLQYADIHIQLVSFFSANMSALLGAMLDIFSTNNNITVSAQARIQAILQKNGFLSYYGYPVISDINNTTIPYRRFKRSDSNVFALYVNDLLNHPDFPSFTPKARMKIAQVIMEIFINATQHTQTNYIYTCGQFYPNKHTIDISIVDIGGGIRNNVNSKLNSQKSSIEAIEWALIDGHTTKQNTPGGYGLTILQEFLHLNGGNLQIISNDGYYCDTPKNKKTWVMCANFPGTVLNLQIRTDDNKLYRLLNE